MFYFNLASLNSEAPSQPPLSLPADWRVLYQTSGSCFPAVAARRPQHNQLPKDTFKQDTWFFVTETLLLAFLEFPLLLKRSFSPNKQEEWELKYLE